MHANKQTNLKNLPSSSLEIELSTELIVALIQSFTILVHV